MKFTNSFTHLDTIFYERVLPEPVPKPTIFLWNSCLAKDLSLTDDLDSLPEDFTQVFSGNTILNSSEPIALAYAGHQFGSFVPQLGDGRAHLLGEIVDCFNQTKEVQLKGSGRTPFSRNGDGRYALGPAIREYIMSESMHALGIPTTRSLAVTTTGETVYRKSPQPGAILTRIASSHIRVGTFEYLAAKQNHQALKQLSEFTIFRHYPDLIEAGEEKFSLLLKQVIERQIKLVIEWLRVGFIHGVMNTDNTAISGETLDFGPCAMMGIYNPETVFSSIDKQGRYSYGNQPAMAHWNMARFAEAILPLIDTNEARAIDIAGSQIETFSKRFKEEYLLMMSKKLGLLQPHPADHKLIFGLLESMQKQQLDYTIIFNQLTQSLSLKSAEQHLHQELGNWYTAWKQRVENQPQTLSDSQATMKQVNPVVIPRNHHMENTITTCLESSDAHAAEEFLEILRTPYNVTNKTPPFQAAAKDSDIGYQTFCGT
ncbi:MAG: YdiU family protein [Candidatus Thiodiazotropha sp.]